ncbi:MAG: hypothetical protein JW809_16220 [Pirellulales bacterium]|nr:hypothetical protein [Pirellulales bacterium]
MRKVLVLLAVAAIALVCCDNAARAAYQKIEFDTLLGGGLSYDQSGADVVANAAGAYRQAVSASGDLTSLQQIGGDGIHNPISGNFAMFGIFHYEDPTDVLGWGASNPTTPFALEVRAWGVGLDANIDQYGQPDPLDGEFDFPESFTLNAIDMPDVDYLSATFAQLGAWGNTDVTQGQGDVRVWMDITLLPGQLAALSVVIDGFATDNWPSVEANLLFGALQGYTPGVTPGSGFYAAVPEPTALLIWTVLGALGAVVFARRK